jgi:hypothetical protein
MFREDRIMRFDMSQSLVPNFLLAPAVYAADNTPVEFDIGQNDALTLLLSVGAGGITFSGTNKVEFVLTHSDVSGGTFVPVTQNDIVGMTVAAGGIIQSLIAAHATPTVYEGGYVGGKPFLRLLADFSGTHGTGTILSCIGVRGRPLKV